MAEAILLLRLEHSHFNGLLNLIEQQLEHDGPIDLALLQNIIDYFTDYPDQCHHPVEDLIFRKMHNRNPSRTGPVGEILRDHRSIAELTVQLAESLTAVADSNGNRAAQLSEIMRQFVDRYRAHMRIEEERFFPLALELLNHIDWAEIEYDLFDQVDPLYHGDVEERFSRLREKIEGLARASYKRAAGLREAQALHQLSTIESFNDLMGKSGRKYRLIEHPEGVYALEHHSEGIIDIPRCSPAQAVWCAYFYVEGLSDAGGAKQSW